MARRFTIELLMDLASQIGANPAKAMSRSNISFLGKGPTKNPLFQNRLAGLENASPQNLGDPKKLFGAIEDAVGWAKDGKLNSIQQEILGHNLSGINKILNQPPLPMASVTALRPGIEGLRRFPKESHKFFGRPLKDKDFSEIDRMIMEGKLPDARGRTWNLKTPSAGDRLYNKLTGLNKPRLVEGQSKLPEPGPGDVERYMGVLNVKTGMSRAIARNLLLKDTRLKLSSKDLSMLKEGKGEPLDLMQKYYGRSMSAYDDFLNQVNLETARPDEFAEMILKNVELIPAFAHGGLARILEI